MDSVALAIVVWAGLMMTCPATTLPSKPNFLVLFADDMGYGDLSYNGHPTIRTPNIDALAEGGMRLTQWYSAFHVCSPSRAAMLTGRLPIRSGTAGTSWTGGVFRESSIGGLPHNETTFAEALKTAGYATGMVGKWHLGQRVEFLPTNNGFDEYFGLPYSDDMGGSAWGHQSVSPPLPLLHNTTIIEQPVNLGTLTQRYGEYAADFINRKKDQHFVLYMAFSHVHTPNFVSKEFCNTSSRGKFGDAAAEMDHAVGVIMNALDEAGIRNNTLTFFTSDNGPWLIQGLQGGSAGPLYEGKTTTWEGGVREPGIVNWPGVIAPAQIGHQVVATYDIFPTMMKLADVALPTDRVIDGRDMSPLFLDPKTPSQHDCIYIYKGTPQNTTQEFKPGLWAIRCGMYKAHFVTNNHRNTTAVFHDPPLLYHLERDAGEVYDLDSTGDEYKEAMATIMAAKQKHQASLKQVPNQMAMGTNPKYKLCCDVNSKQKYPKYPECTCNPDNWNAWTCGRPITYAADTNSMLDGM